MSWTVLPEIPLNARRHVCSGCGIDRLRPLPGAPDRHERWVDSGVFIENQGSIGFCETCLSSAADSLGWVRADRYGNLVTRLDESLIGLNDQRNHIEQLQEQNAALRSALQQLHPDS